MMNCDKPRWAFLLILLSRLFLLAVIGFAWRQAEAHIAHDHIPPAAEQYRRQLTREVRYYFGLREPISPFAAQIHQESAWRSGICSKYACGLAQFTEGTSKDMARMYPKDLEGRAAPLDPNWALRAQALYMKRLDAAFFAPDKWETRAFALAAYNGGSGHILQEKAMAKAEGVDPMKWFLHVERFCKRAEWACTENRAYPRKILFRWEPLYRHAGW
jgi:hypothetical protein